MGAPVAMLLTGVVDSAALAQRAGLGAGLGVKSAVAFAHLQAVLEVPAA